MYSIFAKLLKSYLVTPVALKWEKFSQMKNFSEYNHFFQKKNPFSGKQSFIKGLLGPGKQINLFGLEKYRRVAVWRMILGWWP
jgi:hypothetical protein